MRQHGTYACYVFGPAGSDTRNGCRCGDCAEARRQKARDDARRTEPAYVAAGPAREHLAFLAEHGVGLKTVAKVSGVSHGALWKLVYGIKAGKNRKARPPSKRIRKETLDKILAVTPKDGAGGSRVPAGPTLERIQRLVDAGVPRVRIAERCGQSRSLQIGTEWVTRANERAIKEMCDELEAGTLEVKRVSRWGIHPIEVQTPEPESVQVALDLELVEELAEIMEERAARTWRYDAACKGRPTWMFFPARGDQRTAEKALRICGSCTVRRQCRAESLHQQDGIYGGLSARERRQLRREVS